MITYKKIIKAFELFASGHTQVNDFFTGLVSDFEARESLYPIMVVLPLSSKIENGMTTLTFNIFIADLLLDDRSNQVDALSDTLAIHQDIYAYFSGLDTDDLDLTVEFSDGEAFLEQFSDLLAGWVNTISFSYPVNLSECEIPIIEIE